MPRPIRGFGHIGSLKHGFAAGVPDLVHDSLAAFDIHITDHDARAFAGKQACSRLPLTASRPCNDCHFAIQPSHRTLLR